MQATWTGAGLQADYRQYLIICLLVILFLSNITFPQNEAAVGRW